MIVSTAMRFHTPGQQEDKCNTHPSLSVEAYYAAHRTESTNLLR